MGHPRAAVVGQHTLPGPWQINRFSYAKCPQQGQGHLARLGVAWCGAGTECPMRPSPVQLKHKSFSNPPTRGLSCGKEASSWRKALECKECTGTSSLAPGPECLGSTGWWGHFPTGLRVCWATRELIPDITFWHWGQASTSWKFSQVLRLGVVGPPLGSRGLLFQPLAQHQHPGTRGPALRWALRCREKSG